MVDFLSDQTFILLFTTGISDIYNWNIKDNITTAKTTTKTTNIKTSTPAFVVLASCCIISIFGISAFEGGWRFALFILTGTLCCDTMSYSLGSDSLAAVCTTDVLCALGRVGRRPVSHSVGYRLGWRRHAKRDTFWNRNISPAHFFPHRWRCGKAGELLPPCFAPHRSSQMIGWSICRLDYLLVDYNCMMLYFHCCPLCLPLSREFLFHTRLHKLIRPGSSCWRSYCCLICTHWQHV